MWPKGVLLLASYQPPPRPQREERLNTSTEREDGKAKEMPGYECGVAGGASARCQGPPSWLS